MVSIWTNVAKMVTIVCPRLWAADYRLKGPSQFEAVLEGGMCGLWCRSGSAIHVRILIDTARPFRPNQAFTTAISSLHSNRILGGLTVEFRVYLLPS